jgi:hypothetical protein
LRFLADFNGGRNLHVKIALAVEMLDFHRQQRTLVGQPELGRGHARHAQVQAAKGSCRNLDFLVTDDFDAISAYFLPVTIGKLRPRPRSGNKPNW